jgi:two-component sensor histidine kinase
MEIAGNDTPLGYCIFVPSDTGVGIPEDFDRRNATSPGLRLVILLMDQLDGTIELDLSSKTVFTIVVKEKN